MSEITPHRERLRIARMFIDRNYDSPITVEQISNEAGFSTYHFIRLFHAVYRQTPHQYLMQQRIEKAKDMLRSTALPIIDICYAVGFESLGSFSTLFRREAGLSPSSYRLRASRPAQPTFIPLCYRVKHGLSQTPDSE